MSRSIQAKLEFPLNDLKDRKWEDKNRRVPKTSYNASKWKKVTFECDVYRKLRLMSSSLIHRSPSHSPSHSSVGRASDFRYPARFEPGFEIASALDILEPPDGDCVQAPRSG